MSRSYPIEPISTARHHAALAGTRGGFNAGVHRFAAAPDVWNNNDFGAGA